MLSVVQRGEASHNVYEILRFTQDDVNCQMSTVKCQMSNVN